MKRKLVGLLARDHGLYALKALMNSPSFEVALVFTHRYEPKSLGGKERAEFRHYQEYCCENEIELLEVDSKKEANEMIHSLSFLGDLDVLLSVSWRYLVSKEILERFAFGGVNLHRGLLPNYPGAEPILQALKNGDEQIYISAHKMIEEIDQGKVLKLYGHSVNHLNSLAMDVKINRIKEELGPHFGDLSIEALMLLIGGESNEN